MACIEARGLRKTFGKTIALDGVDLRVEAGRILGLIGPNGAGKTTALNAILGLTAYEGELKVLGHDPWNAREQLMRDVSFIADVSVLPRWMRVSQALDYVAGVHPRFDRAKAEGFLARTAINRTSKVRELSKGMVAQLHLALVMAIDAKLLVLDEPTLGLDILYRKQFYDSLLNDYFDHSRTIIVTTHQVEEIQDVLTDLMFINRGRIVLECSMEEFDSRYLEVMVNPENLDAARALTPMNERPMFGRSVLLFQNANREQLATLGEVRRPSIADLFVAVMGNSQSAIRSPQSAISGRRNKMNTMSASAVESQPVTANPPTRPFYWSVRRELWENRSIYLAPLIVSGLVLFGYLISTIGLPQRRRTLLLLDPDRQRAIVEMPYDFAAIVIMLTAFLVGVFYCLDALHGERRDRSILFWKSLPVSDLTTVLSKVSIPLVILPLLTFAIAIITQVFILLISTAVLVPAGLGATTWQRLPLFQMSVILLYGLITSALWHVPFYAWLLLVSGWARRATFLWAVLPWLAVCIVEKVAFDSTHFARMLSNRVFGRLKDAFIVAKQSHDGGGVPVVDRLSQLDPMNFLSTPGLWIGLFIGAAFFAAAGTTAPLSWTTLIRSKR